MESIFFLLCPTLTKQPAGSDSNCKERQTKKNLVSLGLYPTVGFVLCTFTTLYFELMLQEKFGFFGLSRKVLSECQQWEEVEEDEDEEEAEEEDFTEVGSFLNITVTSASNGE